MIGNILLTVGLFASLFTIVMYYFNYRGYGNALTYARLGYHTTAISVIGASAMLLFAILTQNYEYKYIFNYSNFDLPTGLLMSTFYAGQEGSFMIWLLFTIIVGIVLQDFTSKRGDLEPRVMMVFTLTATFLLVMVSPMLKSPFEAIWAEPTFINVKYINQQLVNLPFLGSHFFQDPNSGDSFIRMSRELYALLLGQGIEINQFIVAGKGLNPLLQNFWMQIHPPLLFVGFSMTAVPFAFGVAAMIKNEYKDWVKQSLPWLLAGMMILGLAIMLGGYWAYGVLGWGGYWGWDPVENSSLVPWIVGVAAIHTMLVQKKSFNEGNNGRFVKTNIILAVMTYLLVLYSTFLTRSGILADASVHSFVAPGKIVYFLLLGFMILFITIGFGGLLFRWKYISNKFKHEENVYSRELALFTGSVVLLASAVIILAGTSAPIWGSAVELRFYNELNLPIAIIIGLLNGFSLLLKWNHTKPQSIIKSSRNSLALGTIFTLGVVVLGGVYDVMLIIFTWSTAFALFVNLEVMAKIVKGKVSYTGAYIAHAGIALFLLGVIATGGYTADKSMELIKGKPTEVLGRTLTFTGFTPFANGTKYKFNVQIGEGEDATVVSPVMYIAEFNNSLMREPDILNQLTSDFYVSPLGYSDGTSQEGNGSQNLVLKKGGSTETNGVKIEFTGFNFAEESMSAMMSGKPFQIGAFVTISKDGNSKDVELVMKSDGKNRTFEKVTLDEFKVDLVLNSLDASGSINLSVVGEGQADNKTPQKKLEVLTVDASFKPFINLVWLGVLVMTAGFFVSTIRRLKESRK